MANASNYITLHIDIHIHMDAAASAACIQIVCLRNTFFPSQYCHSGRKMQSHASNVRNTFNATNSCSISINMACVSVCRTLIPIVVYDSEFVTTQMESDALSVSLSSHRSSVPRAPGVSIRSLHSSSVSGYARCAMILMRMHGHRSRK